MGNIPYPKTESGGSFPRALAVLTLALFFIGALTVVRLLYEALFPSALWLREPAAAVVLATVLAASAAFLTLRLGRTPPTVALTPLLLNLAYLFNPAAALLMGRFLFLASIWLAALFITHRHGLFQRRPFLWPLFVVSLLLPVYLLTLGQQVGTADTFEFQVVIPRLGIVHPTGYPLYLLLTKLFTFIPLNTVAWRINLGTAVYGAAAACLLFLFLRSLTGQRVVPVLAAVLFGLSPTFWSQSIEAEVYSLHALIAAAVLLLVQRVGCWRLDWGGKRPQPQNKPALTAGKDRNTLFLAATLGLGLTNHLTTIILLPAVLLTGAATIISNRKWTLAFNFREILTILAAFLAPLLLYLYLPFRWQAVNGEAMGMARFVDWVVGGRFQGALQPMAWLNDPARWEVVGRLMTAEWGGVHLLIGVIGVIVLARRLWPAALFLALVWLGFAYYALSYYVPDLSVFLIPAHLVTAALWGIGVAAAVRLLTDRIEGGRFLIYPLLSLLMFFVFQQAVITWTRVDASGKDGQTTWGRATLALPLDPQGAILADSVRFPPLYYLQQAEGIQPEMDIVVLPDEAAYRAALDGRLAAGKSVYLARFLPGLAGVYHLRSVGPLTEVSSQPITTLPETADVTATNLTFDSVKLIGYEVQMVSAYEAGQTAVTFYWQTAEAVDPAWQVYVRWAGEQYQGATASQFAANDYYPTNAWRPGEIVVDFHSLPRPVVNESAELALQVALAPPFTPAEELTWQTVATTVWEPGAALLEAQTRRLQVGPLLIDGVSMPGQIRPEADLVVQLHGYGTDPDSVVLQLQPVDGYISTPSDFGRLNAQADSPFVWAENVATDVEPGSYFLTASYPGEAAVCSWLAAETSGCILGQIEVSGVPLPEGAFNFEDQIALTEVEVPDRRVQPGGQLVVELSWLGLSDMTADYTIFVQVVDEQDRIIGQEDSWPLQGTFPTSQWQPGEVVADTFVVRLDSELPPGQYRLYVGWYLLATQRRLPIVDELGTAVDNKVVIPLGEYP